MQFNFKNPFNKNRIVYVRQESGHHKRTFQNFFLRMN